jgi:hypothetical protein
MLTAGQQANVRSGLTGLVQSGLARVSPHSSGIIHLTSAGLSELRRILRLRTPAASGPKRHQMADEPEPRRSARAPDQAEPVGRGASRNRTMDPRLVQGEPVPRRRPGGYARDTAGGVVRTFQVFTPAELWRLDRSSVIKLEPRGDAGENRPVSVNSEAGSAFDFQDTGSGFQDADIGADYRNAEQDFAASVENDPQRHDYESQRSDSNDASSGRGYAGHDAERNYRSNSRSNETRGENAPPREPRPVRGEPAARSGRGPSLDELRTMARGEGRRR